MYQTPENAEFLIHSSKKEITGGKLLSLKTDIGISSVGSYCNNENSAYFIFNIYYGGSYKVCFLEINNNADIISVLSETEGVLPKLFKDPEGKLWTVFTYSKIDGFKELILPLGDRTNTPEQKPLREFASDLIGYNDGLALFYKKGQKTDELGKIKFDKNGHFKERKASRIEVPKENQPFINELGEIHLIAYDTYPKRLHRQIDLDGKVLKSRTIDTKAHHFGILDISFEKNAHFISTNDNKIFYETVSPEGKISQKLLIEIPEIKEYFYWMTAPLALGGGRYIFNFTSPSFNGWVVTEKECVLECFTYNSDEKAYVDRINGIKLSVDFENPVIGQTVAFDKNHYAVLLYQSGRNTKNVEIYLRNLS